MPFSRPPEQPRHSFKRRLVTQTVTLVGLVWMVMTGIGWLGKEIYDQGLKQRQIDSHNSHLALAEHFFHEELLRVVQDVHNISAADPVRRFMTTHNPNDRLAVEAMLLRTADIFGRYSQIKILAMNGRELIRVNREDGKTRVVRTGNLQHPVDRYYVAQGATLTPDEVYVSPLDLTVDQEQIKFPITPVIRAVRQITNDDGIAIGMLVMNYSARGMLDYYRNLMIEGGAYGLLANQDGYWLAARNLTDDWGWQLDRPRANLAHSDPQLWQFMQGKSEGVIDRGDTLISFQRIEPTEFYYDTMDGRFPEDFGVKTDILGQVWYALALTENSEWLNGAFYRRPVVQAVIFVLYLCSAAVGWQISYYRCKLAQQRQQFEDYLKEAASTDPLTGALNRRSFEQLAHREIMRAKRNGNPISIMSLDVDHFKSINDTYGHHVGDMVIRALSDHCRNSLRQTDIFARVGGEEFVVVLPDTGFDAAMAKAETLRKALNTEPIMTDNSLQVGFSVSIGVASAFGHDDPDIATLQRIADEKLYEAKSHGRNQVRG